MVRRDFRGFQMSSPGDVTEIAMAAPRDTKRVPETGKADPVTSSLAARIAQARGKQPAQASDRVRRWELTGVGRAYRLAAEFVAAIIVGAGLGWIIDFFLGTAPWGMVVLLLLGFAAGVLNMVRATAEMNAARPNGPVPPAAANGDKNE